MGIKPPSGDLTIWEDKLSIRPVLVRPDVSAVFSAAQKFDSGSRLASRYAPATTVELASGYDLSDDAGSKVIYFLVLALKIVFDASIQCPIGSSKSFDCIFCSDEKSISFNAFEDVPEMVRISESANIDSAKLEWIRNNLFSMIKLAGGTEISNRYVLATELMFVWSYTKSHRIALMTLWSAIDAIFGKNERSIKRNMAGRVSVYLPNFKYNDFCTAYEDRCSVMHGRKIDTVTLSSALIYAKSLVSAALMKVIETGTAPLPDWN
ncbi:MAG: hypothetical protein ACOH2H_10050 [Cypionkella sp.]